MARRARIQRLHFPPSLPPSRRHAHTPQPLRQNTNKTVPLLVPTPCCATKPVHSTRNLRMNGSMDLDGPKDAQDTRTHTHVPLGRHTHTRTRTRTHRQPTTLLQAGSRPKHTPVVVLTDTDTHVCMHQSTGRFTHSFCWILVGHGVEERLGLLLSLADLRKVPLELTGHQTNSVVCDS